MATLIAHTPRLGSMCILQACNNQAHWGVKKDLCDGCSCVCLERRKCRAGASVNQVHEEEEKKQDALYLFLCFVAPSGGGFSVAFKTLRCTGRYWFPVAGRTQTIGYADCVCLKVNGIGVGGGKQMQR